MAATSFRTTQCGYNGGALFQKGRFRGLATKGVVNFGFLLHFSLPPHRLLDVEIVEFCWFQARESFKIKLYYLHGHIFSWFQSFDQATLSSVDVLYTILSIYQDQDRTWTVFRTKILFSRFVFVLDIFKMDFKLIRSGGWKSMIQLRREEGIEACRVNRSFRGWRRGTCGTLFLVGTGSLHTRGAPKTLDLREEGTRLV